MRRESVLILIISDCWDTGQDIGHADAQADESRHKAQPAVCRKAVHEVTEETAGCHHCDIRNLRADVVDMVALCTRRSQDGRIGNRRSMVAADSARKNGGNADDEHVGVIRAEHGDGNRDEDAKCTPRGSRRKGQTDGYEEENRRQEQDDRGMRADDGADKAAEVKILLAADARKRPGQAEDEDGRCHGLEAPAKAVTERIERDDAARQIQETREDEGNERA